MLSTFLGVSAFALFFLYDVNSFLWKLHLPRKFFLAGTLLLAASAVLDIHAAARNGEFSGISDIILLTFSTFSLGLLIYSLFFALPFTETYSHQEEHRNVCKTGIYALCRHPGNLCFFAAYLFVGIAAPKAFAFNGILFSFLNLGYACFQDRVTFPKTFGDYEQYRTCVPFLIPTKDSICMAVKTLRHAYTKEDNL